VLLTPTRGDATPTQVTLESRVGVPARDLQLDDVEDVQAESMAAEVMNADDGENEAPGKKLKGLDEEKGEPGASKANGVNMEAGAEAVQTAAGTVQRMQRLYRKAQGIVTQVRRRVSPEGLADARDQAEGALDDARDQAKGQARVKFKKIISPANLYKHLNRPVRIFFLVLSISFAAVTLVPPLLLLFPLRYICPTAYYTLANPIFSQVWAVCTVAFEVFGGLNIAYFGDEPLPGEKFVVVANHYSNLDWLVLVGLAARFNVQGGARFIAQTPVRNIPFLGTALWLHQTGVSLGVLSTSRTLAYYTQGSVWICFFPEDDSLLPIRKHSKTLTHLAQPVSKYVKLALQGANHQMTHVLDLTLAYYENGPSDGASSATITNALFGTVAVDVLMRRVEFPRDVEETEPWLHRIWEEKGKALQAWNRDSASWFEEAPFQHSTLRLTSLPCGLILFVLPYLLLGFGILAGLVFQKATGVSV